MNPYCRRAVAKACRARGRARGLRRVTVFTLGPPAADDTLREAIAWGLERDVDIDGRARDRPRVRGFRHARDREGARRRAHARRAVRPRARRPQLGRRRHRAGRPRARRAARPPVPHRRPPPRDRRRPRRRAVRARRRLAAGRGAPAGDPVDAPSASSTRPRSTRRARAAVPAERIRRRRRRPRRRSVGAGRVAHLGRAGQGHGRRPRPARAGPTRRSPSRSRAAVQYPRASAARSTPTADHEVTATVPESRTQLAVHGRRRSSPTARHCGRELLGAAAQLDRQRARGHARKHRMPSQLVSWGADEIVHLDGENVEEDVARAVADLARREPPWAILVPSTAWGREVASRVAARARRRPRRRRRRARTSKATGSSRGSRRSAASSSPRSAARRRCRWRPSAPACSRRSRRVPRAAIGVRDDRARRTRPRARARAHPRRRPRRARRGAHGHRRRHRRRARRVRRARTAARRARRRARRDAQGHRQGLAAPRPPDRHHRPHDRAPPVRQHRRERQVQPHGRRARRGHRARDQPRPGRADLRRTPTSASSATGTTSLPLLVEQLRARNA